MLQEIMHNNPNVHTTPATAYRQSQGRAANINTFSVIKPQPNLLRVTAIHIQHPSANLKAFFKHCRIALEVPIRYTSSNKIFLLRHLLSASLQSEL